MNGTGFAQELAAGRCTEKLDPPFNQRSQVYTPILRVICSWERLHLLQGNCSMTAHVFDLPLQVAWQQQRYKSACLSLKNINIITTALKSDNIYCTVLGRIWQHIVIILAQSAVHSQPETHAFFHSKHLRVYLELRQLHGTSAFPFIPSGMPGATHDIHAHSHRRVLSLCLARCQGWKHLSEWNIKHTITSLLKNSLHSDE